MPLLSCVAPEGKFIYGLHKPHFRVQNLREHDFIAPLGQAKQGAAIDNSRNFPAADLSEDAADWIFEIPNPLPFRGSTYISKSWADAKADDLAKIFLPKPAPVSLAPFLQGVRETGGNQADTDPAEDYRRLPEAVLLALAACSTDTEELIRLARLSCAFSNHPDSAAPTGLLYHNDTRGRLQPLIYNLALFETLVNNGHLPDEYKRVMVLRPGVQGGSEIVGEWSSDNGHSHIFEYLRRNSYIPWGHYAANMADDAVRYHISDLSAHDMTGLRHLYYQRSFVRLAEELGLAPPKGRQTLTREELEDLRCKILVAMHSAASDRPVMNNTLWGWNFGFDYSPSHYRLHASHQQIHQQYALLPREVETWHDYASPATHQLAPYSCGDLVADFIGRYRRESGADFFTAYIKAIRNNKRMDRATGETSLIIHEDSRVMLFVPKAQTSQWEIQLMPLAPVGNILEADTATRDALDHGILLAQKILEKLGAQLVTSIEFPKRFDAGANGQHLLYAFLPKLPYSMGAFSEAQLRFINGHYPEDFAAACRLQLQEILRQKE